jgi:alpha-amylase/alpha-mannosidase (GH57 family)
MENSARPRHLIIHGHFYQPPRENPWTETIERQESAAPYHDWNDRIANECYLPNSLSRRLDDYGRIAKLVNNYEWISFNFGPTLISWLEDHVPEAYARILEADRSSAKRLNGHGNAIAQCYNHSIMPLASRRDQETQIRWGIRDFERRFGRPSEGIWLPETAINAAVLEMLVEFAFRFIVLSPHQALRMRSLDDASHWKDVSKGTIPAGFPYRCFAPGARGKRDSRRFIDVFFYDAPLSTDVSFNHLLRNGDGLADAISLAYPRGGDDLVVVATDGEIYGHHEPFADMALSYLVESAAPRRGLALTNFGAYLDAHEPRFEVELKPGPNGEGTAWSCVHGVDRWKEDCGDSAGGGPGWNQKWRAPLRTGLNNLRDALAAHYEREASKLLADPWKARDEYIGVVENRSRDTAAAFVAAHAAAPLASRVAAERPAHVHLVRVVLQRHLGDRDRADHAVRRARHRARRNGALALAREEAPRRPQGRGEQRRRERHRREHLQQQRKGVDPRPPVLRRALRDHGSSIGA